MNVLHRAWRVYADPVASQAAYVMRALILVECVLTIMRAVVAGVMGVDLSFLPPPHRLIDMAWMYAVLWFVRQRDEARAAASMPPAITNR